MDGSITSPGWPECPIRMILASANKRTVLFYGTKDHRGYLISWTSAMLHMSRMALLQPVPYYLLSEDAKALLDDDSKFSITFGSILHCQEQMPVLPSWMQTILKLMGWALMPGLSPPCKFGFRLADRARP